MNVENKISKVKGEGKEMLKRLVNKWKDWKNPQRGQAIVLIAILSIGLIAAMGLAIDSGRLFFLHRDLQNSADAGALAAAQAICKGNNPVQAAEALAAANGFVQGEPYYNDADEFISVDVNITDDPLYRNHFPEVKITAGIPAAFIGIVYTGPLKATGRAVGFCQRLDDIIISAASEVCDIPFSATGDLDLAGSVYSGGNISISATGSINGFVIGEGEIAIDGGIALVPDEGNPKSFDVPTEATPPYILADFAPTSSYVINAQNAGVYYHHDKDWVVDSSVIPWGLHYVVGDVIITGSWSAESYLTIVATGSIYVEANGQVVEPYILGPNNALLFYSDAKTDCGAAAVTLNLTNATFAGGIVAPQGGINITSDTSTTGRLFGQEVNISGTSIQISDPDHLEPVVKLIGFAE